MDHLSNIPITILVKAPNQKIGDQTVECFMDWTVRRLKSHLSAVYPNRPTEKSQRIIYSGKLLQDNSVLQDVLRVIDDEALHTVHLVCTPSPEELAEIDRCSVSSSKSKKSSNQTNAPSGAATPTRSESTGNSASSSRRTSTGDASTDGVRQRNVTRSNSSGSTGYSTQYMQQFSIPGSPTAYQNMSPQQLQWMQQMYMQQMAAYYMQYHSGSGQGLPGVSPPWTPPAAYQFPQPMAQPHPMGNLNAPGNQPLPAVGNDNVMPQAAGVNVEPPRNAPRVQNQQMNAGVGPVINDDEEDGANRDWLDWIYTLCRLGFLLSFVYFYSSLNRFLLVAGMMLVMYLYEHNFFRLHRRPVARVQAEERGNPQEENRQEPGEVREDVPDERQASETPVDDSTPSTSENSDVDGQATNEDAAEELTTTEPEGLPRPGFFWMLWVFVSTFFMSLIPVGPQHLNAN